MNNNHSNFNYNNPDSHNDLGFHGSIGFESSIGFEASPGLDSLTANNVNTDPNNGLEYLDQFYLDCINNHKAHNSLMKHESIKRNLCNIIVITGGILSFLMIGIGANMSSKLAGRFVIFGFYMFCAVILFGGISLMFLLSKRKRKNIEELSDGIRYGLLNDYLRTVDCKKFAEGKARCLTANSIPNEEPAEDVKLVLQIALPAIALGLLAAYLKFGSVSMLCICFLLLLFGGIGIGFCFFGVIRYYLKTKEYKETVDAVCIEINSKISRDFDTSKSHRVYQPVFFAKCQNGHKYLLFHNEYSNMGVPNVGDIVQLKVDSSNPLNFAKKGDWIRYIFMFVMGAAFAAMGLGTYLWILLSMPV